MNSLLSYFMPQEDDLVFISQELIRHLGVNVTARSVKEQLQQHPEYPSLLSLSESLDRWKIDNAALTLTEDQFKELTPPFICPIVSGPQLDFVFVTSFTHDHIFFTNGFGKKKKADHNLFFEKWNGVVLLAEATEQSGEKAYEGKAKKEQASRQRVKFLFAIGVITLMLAIFQFAGIYWQVLCLIATCVTGLIISSLLVYVELSSDQQRGIGICTVHEKADCKKVLQSPASRIGKASMAEIGLIFFLVNLLTIFLTSGDIHSSYFSVLLVLHAFALPYTLFSIFYQWRVIKLWCVLCLGIQFLLWADFFVLYSFAAQTIQNVTSVVMPFTILLIAVTLFWMAFKPLIEKASMTDYWKQQHQKMKLNSTLFHSYLNQHAVLPDFGTMNPVVLGDPNAEHAFTVVVGAFCDPCGAMHQKLEQFIGPGKNIKINLVFSTCYHRDTPRIQIVQHLMALEREGGNVQDALHAWYAQPKKDYEQWSIRFPVGDLSHTDEQVEAHCDWCTRAGIDKTPTLFVDGLLAPALYEVEEMGEMIEQLPLRESAVLS